MGFKYLNLRKTRLLSVKNHEAGPSYPGRRQFLKTMGLGAVAWHPLAESIKSLTFDPLKFSYKSNRLKVYYQNKLAWEISEKYFEPGYKVNLIQDGNHYRIKAGHLQFRNTSLRFSMKADINHSNGWWECTMQIPEFNFGWSGNFCHWLEGTRLIKGTAKIDQTVTHLNDADALKLEGAFQLSLSPQWQVSLKALNGVRLQRGNHLLTSSQLRIDAACNNHPPFVKSNRRTFTQLTLPVFNDWESFFDTLDLDQGHLTALNNPSAELCMALLHANSQGKYLWIQQPEANLLFETERIFDRPVPLTRFFYYKEYTSALSASSYMSAGLPANGNWLTNQLGAFKLENDDQHPVFEAFAANDHFNRIIMEPRLSAFTPLVGNAVVLSTIFQTPKKVLVTKPQKTAQDPVIKRVQKPEIKFEYNQLSFKPQLAITIKVLRPEDLLSLEFVFHNFSFTNRGEAPFLELSNAKKEGIVEVYFNSQHTLEEAWFETTNIKDNDPLKPADVGVKPPAKHLRARKSRLVYELPAGHEGFPLIMSELLNWDKYKLRVHPRAWIKVPVISKFITPKDLKADKQLIASPNPNLKYLDTPTTEYGIRLTQNTRLKADHQDVYQESQMSKFLPPQNAISAGPTFNAKEVLKRVIWKVEPIPPLTTSIEAPALMYISPNQTNGFYHQTEIRFIKGPKEQETASTQAQPPVQQSQAQQSQAQQSQIQQSQIQQNQIQQSQVQQSQVQQSQVQLFKPGLRTIGILQTVEGEITELWHTRLGVRLSNGKTSVKVLPHLKTIRALWADEADPDYRVAKNRNYPFMAPLDASNRQKLVHITSNYNVGFEPFPVPVNDLMLTSLGAYLDWHAFFDVPTPYDGPLNIVEWEQISTLGRDQYVKIVEEGYLFPFGHRAAVAKVTERKFDSATKAAALRQRMYVVVLEKEVLYARSDPQGKFIEFPFQAVRIKTGATPNIENPENSTLVKVPATPGGSGNTLYNFYINVGPNKGYPFDMVATDKEGGEHYFQMPLVFIENAMARDKSLMQQVINKYRGSSSDGYNKVNNESDFRGQEMAYAEYLVEGDTTFETEMVKFDAQIYPVNNAGALKFHPTMKEARIFVKQINELTGIREPATIGLEDDKNQGTLFARVISSNVVDFSGGSDKSGGFLSPNMPVSGLSKLQGPVNGKLNNLKALKFVPKDFFAELPTLPMAKIFGVIDLLSLLFGTDSNPLDLGGSFDGMKDAVQNIRDEIESLKNDLLYLENLKKETGENVEAQLNEKKQLLKNKAGELLAALNSAIPRIPNLKAYATPEAFYAEYKWQPQLKGTNINVIPSLLNVHVANPANALTVTTRFEKPFDAALSASMNGVARFEKFTIDIVPLLEVKFNYLEFKTGSSQKTDVKVDIDKNDPIKFKGVLNFVNSLQSIIPSGGFSDDGPYIDLKPTSVTAGFNISVPSVEVGICMLSNVTLGAYVNLPFTGAPLTIGFNFCKRDNPFILTISCFGGGGYFLMVTTLKGIQSIEAAFEFGAALSLNVGVASGGVSAMGGFYYKMEMVEGEETTTLSGYLRLNGHLSILGLISLSLEFYLAFNAVLYAGKVQKLEGVATLKVKVEVLFFSKTVKITVRRELKGADADPKFSEMIEKEDWEEYCLAFAG